MTTEEMIARAIEIKRILDSQKVLYEELEQITLALVGPALGGAPLATGEHVVTLVDNFADKNTVFRTAAVRRFELLIQTTEEFAYSNMSRAEKTAYTKAKNKTMKEGE